MITPNRRSARDLTRDRVNDVLKLLGKLEKSALRANLEQGEADLMLRTVADRVLRVERALADQRDSQPVFDWDSGRGEFEDRVEGTEDSIEIDPPGREPKPKATR